MEQVDTSDFRFVSISLLASRGTLLVPRHAWKCQSCTTVVSSLIAFLIVHATYIFFITTHV